MLKYIIFKSEMFSASVLLLLWYFNLFNVLSLAAKAFKSSYKILTFTVEKRLLPLAEKN